MTDDTRLAFGHPSERAAATADTGGTGVSLDRISLRDHIVSVEIGAFQAERGNTQRLRFDVVVEVAPPDAPLGDDVDRILSYDRITEAISAELAEERLNLLETLAERVADRILRDPRAARVFLRIEKLDRGPGALGVEIERRRPAAGAQEAPGRTQAAADHAAPQVVFLGPAARGAVLPGLLDRICAQGLPAILCTGPVATAPRAQEDAAQQRLDLLEIEQAAWLLADRDPRLSVAATRTEIDWALTRGKLTVWAPVKLVTDAVSPRPPRDAEGPELALWLAGQLGARRLVCVEAAAPAAVAGGPEVESRRAAEFS